MSSPGTLRFAEVNTKPSAPPAGYNLIYVKTDDILYLQDSSGTETALGSASVITALTGDVTAVGPGSAHATVTAIQGFAVDTSAPTDAEWLIYNTTANKYIANAMSGDATMTHSGVVTVGSVGGSSAANIHSAELAANAATSTNTASTIVERDPSGDFAAHFITANTFIGNLTGNASGSSGSFTGSLVGDVTGTQGATVVSLVGGSSAANVHSAELAANAATSANIPSTIVKRDGSGNIVVSRIDAAAIGINDTSATAAAYFKTSAIGLPTLVIKQIVGQTANLMEIRDSSNAVEMQFTAGGNFQFYNSVAIPEARMDLRPSVNIASSSVGAAARYSVFIGDPTQPIVAGEGGGIAFGGMQDNSGTATEFGYIWVTKDNATPGDISAGMHFATRNNSTGKAQRVLDMDSSGNSVFFGNVTTAFAFIGNLTGNVTGNLTGNVTGNVSGTASNITASTNSTLTTLTALSLPTSQLSGTIVLTTQVSGVLPFVNGGTNNSSAYTAGSIIFSNGTSLTQDNSQFFWDDTAKALGIGTIPSAIAVVDVVNNSGATKAIQLTGYGGNVGIRGRYANGTLALPTAATTGNLLEFISGRGYGSTGFAAASTGAMNIVAAATFTDTSMPTYISFSTTPSAAVTAIERMRITQAGNVLIDTTTDNGVDSLQIGSGAIASYYKITGSISGYVQLAASAITSTYTLTFPSDGGTAGSVLTSDGFGGLSYSNPSANIDGGVASSIYLIGQFVNGGTP